MNNSSENKILISVLMSIYNEDINDIYLSIESICRQTYELWELIIVIDNPEKYNILDIKKIIDDERIYVYKNERNIGLAESMNYAASLARGDVLARMDADDISDIYRFEKEISYMTNNGYDLVCTDYKYIDNSGNEIEREKINVNSEIISKVLPYFNPIHHPTIMIKKEIFDRVNGYRNFPCAQDYDLWLRLLEVNCKFGIINEQLFSYRIRTESITSKNRIKQMMTMQYARIMRKQRMKKGFDKFSEEDYLKYLSIHNLNDSNYVKKINSCFEKRKQRNVFVILFYIMTNDFFRLYYYNAIKCRFTLVVK